MIHDLALAFGFLAALFGMFAAGADRVGNRDSTRTLLIACITCAAVAITLLVLQRAGA